MLKKVLATALAAAMIFGLAATAFAAPVFPDTEGVANENDIAKLKALAIVKGDDLGNFNPDNPITRAEFTAMVTRMLGLETAASYLSSPTLFPDVTAEYSWAYGYINIATGRGLIKGYEDGTFRPGADVTQAEALTILVRALGYNDNLPGTWPVDYVMKGAEIGIIEAGFGTDVAATRALIAALVVNTLDEDVVKEDPDAAGNFIDKYGSERTLYADVFDADLAAVTGELTAYSTSNKTVTVGGTKYTYATGVAIWGQDSIADLVGENVELTFNKDDKVCFIAVTTENVVVGEITAVNTSKATVTVGGVVYDVDEDAAIVKNGFELDGTIASKLAEIEDADAKLYLDDDVVYRITANILDQTGTLTGKVTEVKAGKVVYKITVSSGTFDLDEDVVIVRNGASAAFADLKKGDSLKWAYDSDDKVVTYIDAFSNVIEGATLVGLRTTTAGTVATLEVDGVETDYTIIKKSKYLADAVPVANLLADEEYDVTFDRDGLIIGFALSTAEGASTDGDVLAVVAKNTTGSSSNRKYNLELSDDTTVVLNDFFAATADYKFIYVNGVERYNKTAGTGDLDEARLLYNAIAVDDLVKAATVTDAMTSDVTATIEVFADSITGTIIDNGLEFTIDPSSTTAGDEVTFLGTWSTDVTVNGTTVGATEAMTVIPGTADDLITATVKFGGKTGADATEVIASELAVENFSASTMVEMSVVSVSASGHKYTISLIDAEGYAEDAEITDDRDCVVIKDDEEATLEDIQVGDIVWFSDAINVSGEYTDQFVKAVTDEEEPTFTGAAWTYSASADTVTVEFEINSTVAADDYPLANAPGTVWVWVGNTLTEFDSDEVAVNASGVWKVVVTDVTSAPSKVTVQIADYAGNESVVRTATAGGTTGGTTVDVTAVTLNKSTLILTIGTHTAETLVATVAPSDATDKAVTWISSDPDVATVNSNGRVVAQSAGTCTIIVITDDGDFEASCAVTVN